MSAHGSSESCRKIRHAVRYQLSVELHVVLLQGHTKSGNLKRVNRNDAMLWRLTFRGTCSMPKKTRANCVGIAAQNAFQFVRLKSFSPDQPFPQGWRTITHKVGIKLPPGLGVLPHIEYPAVLPQIRHIQSVDCHDDVEDDGDDEEVSGENQLVMVEVCEDTKDDGEKEWDCPEKNSMG